MNYDRVKLEQQQDAQILFEFLSFIMPINYLYQKIGLMYIVTTHV